jgi:hypothetical protein
MSLRLNLGACDRRITGFLSVDICPPADVVTDLRELWPWEDSSVQEVRAHDIFEHLPDRIHTMNELWRVLCPGGTATVEVPSAAHGAGFACDPTHVSAWCLASFQYFEEGSACHTRFARSYGIWARFRVRSLKETPDPSHPEPVWKVTAVLEAVR